MRRRRCWICYTEGSLWAVGVTQPPWTQVEAVLPPRRGRMVLARRRSHRDESTQGLALDGRRVWRTIQRAERITRRPMDMHPHLSFLSGSLLAEGASLDRMINGILVAFSAAGLPALLGGPALWLGRPRDLWALVALILGLCSIVPAVYFLRFLWKEDGAAWPFYVAAGWPLLLGLVVCARACRVLATAE